LRALSEFVVRVANLAEAEGRLVREKTLEMISATLLWLTAALLAVAGVLALFAALYLGLRVFIHPAFAMAIVGILPLALAGLCLMLGKRALKGGK
jgi:hypothetical protein